MVEGSKGSSDYKPVPSGVPSPGGEQGSPTNAKNTEQEPPHPDAQSRAPRPGEASPGTPTTDTEADLKRRISTDLKRVAQAYLLAKQGYVPAVTLSVREFDSFVTAVIEPIMTSLQTINSIIGPARKAEKVKKGKEDA